MPPFAQVTFGETKAGHQRGLFKASFDLMEHWLVGRPTSRVQECPSGSQVWSTAEEGAEVFPDRRAGRTTRACRSGGCLG